MRNKALLNLRGYVGSDPTFPSPNKAPNFITFQVGVSTSWIDKSGNQQKQTTWFRCHSNFENVSVFIKKYIRQGQGVEIKGIPKISTFNNKEGKSMTTIEVDIKYLQDIEILTYPKDKENNIFDEKEEITFDEIPF